MLNMHILRNLIGVLCNKLFVNIGRDNIVDYYKLAFIQIVGTFIPLLYMNKLIPSREEIREVQMRHMKHI